MTLSQLLASTREWRRILLEDPLPEGLAQTLPEFLKGIGHEFLNRAPRHPDADTESALNLWYGSSAGQEVLANFTIKLWSQMSTLSAHAMPAHDARHAMFKVPATALEYLEAENVQGWGRLGLLGGLLHDYGRWAEERIWGGPGESLSHSRLSFLLGRELLEQFNMPEAAKEQILLAALLHTTGAGPQDPMPLKLTVTADREQLCGPELVLRLFHHGVGPVGQVGSFYGEVKGETVLDRCYRFLRHRLPGPLFTRMELLDNLWWDLAYFILRCEPYGTSKARFEGDNPLQRDGFVWEDAWFRARDVCPRESRPELPASRLLASANVAPNPRFKLAALDKTHLVAKPARAALGSALAYIADRLHEEDRRQLTSLRRIRKDNPDDALVQALSQRLIAGWFGSSV